MRNKILIYLALSVVVTGLTPTITSAGSIIGWGWNAYGQASPPAGNDFVAIAAGVYHSLALKSDGSIVGWGNNDYGQASPPAGNDFVAIAAGGYHSLALKSDGSIVGWGWNMQWNWYGYNYYWRGQAIPPAGNDFVAIAAGAFHSLALKSDGSIVGWGSNQDPWGGPESWSGQATPPAGNDFVAISTTAYHSLALKSDGSIVGWGWNAFGQASPPAGNNFVAIAACQNHSLALKSDSSIVGWGACDSPPTGNNFVAIAGMLHSLALKSDGSIVGWGNNDYGEASPPAGNDFVAIAAGNFYSLTLVKQAQTAIVDIDPDTLNLKSKGKWITCYIELPEGYNVGDIDISTIMLNGQVPAESKPTAIADYDGDGTAELMVKFSRSAVQNMLLAEGEAEITVAGELADGTAFEGKDTIRTIDEGK